MSNATFFGILRLFFVIPFIGDFLVNGDIELGTLCKNIQEMLELK